MLKKITILVIVLLFVSLGQAVAQVADTVDVPTMDAEGPVGALPRFILGDTTSTGERVNLNRVYRLKRGERYLVNGKIFVEFPLTLIAEDDETKQLPVIAPFPLDDGSIPRITFYCYEDAYFKDIYFLGVAPTGQRNGWDRPLILGGEATMIVEGCVVDGYAASGIANIGENTSLYIKDCIWRNNNLWQFGGQTFFNYGSAMDTVSIINTTFLNGASYFLCSTREYAEYIRFEHNTLFNNNTNPFYTPYLDKADIKNNIFFNAASAGETAQEKEEGWYDWDGERMSIFSIDTLPTDWNLNESGREIMLQNNAYFWDPKISGYLASLDSVDAPVWINDRTKAMFDDDTNYPGLVMENNVEADPGFNADVMKYVDSLLTFITALREGGDNGFSYASTQFPGVWPIETLDYTNSDLLTASTLGFPLGDLNWFPDKKAEWEDKVSAIDENTNIGIVKEFSLSQNYPNPFNPTTMINYSVPEVSNVKLSVFDILGREVAVLVTGEKKAGNHKINFDASNLSSGIYFYKLQAGNFVATKKLMLLK